MSKHEPIQCDNCGAKAEATWICDKCVGLFCSDCVAFVESGPPVDARLEVGHPGDLGGKVLCHKCDGVGGAAAHARRMGRERT